MHPGRFSPSPQGRPRGPGRLTAWLGLVAAGVMVVGGPAPAPAAPPTTPPTTRPSTRPAQSQSSTAPTVDDKRPDDAPAPPILGGIPGKRVAPRNGPPVGEGTILRQIKGTVTHNEATDWWHFRVAREPGMDPYEMPLVPSTMLANMLRLVDSMPSREFVFDLTGQVLVYHGRNYLLPTHAPRLTGYLPSRQVKEPPTTQPTDGDTVNDILSDLKSRVGPVPRSPRTADRDREVLDTTAEGTLLLWRRGWMVHESGGAWTFVFEADAKGLADPPLFLLPCLLLQRMEGYAERAGREAPLLVSGRIYRFKRRTYLLPTAFQIPRERTILRP